MAGRNVSEVAMVRATAMAAAADTPYRKLTPRANWPSRAMQTVSPASSTVRPDVPAA
jgi:hypothetical protein